MKSFKIVFGTDSADNPYATGYSASFKEREVNPSGLDYYEVWIDSPKSDWATLIAPKIEVLNFGGVPIDNRSPDFAFATRYVQHSEFDANRYAGFTGSTSDDYIVVNPMRINGITSKYFIDGFSGFNDIAFLPIHNSSVLSIFANSLGITKLVTSDTSLLAVSIKKLDLLDAQYQLPAGYSYLSTDIDGGYIGNKLVAANTYNGVDSRKELKSITGGNDLRIFLGNESAWSINGQEGYDLVVFPDWNTNDIITWKFSNGSWDLFFHGGNHRLENVEFVQFSDTAFRLGSDGIRTELPFNNNLKNTYNVVLSGICDFDGYPHGIKGYASRLLASSYKYQGTCDVNNDGIKEEVYTNKESSRWVTLHRDAVTGIPEYSDHGRGGITRVVGIYIDPLVAEGEANNGRLKNGQIAPVRNGEFDSQRRFLNDLRSDNLILRASGDYNKDGFQELYWKTADGTAYLRSIMHADGNIQYANYQNTTQMMAYLKGNNIQDVINQVL